MSNDVSYRVAITRRDGDKLTTIDWDGHALLSELLTDIMERAAQNGWLDDWPDLPNPEWLVAEKPEEMP
jgi:hypothetical protein